MVVDRGYIVIYLYVLHKGFLETLQSTILHISFCIAVLKICMKNVKKKTYRAIHPLSVHPVHPVHPVHSITIRTIDNILVNLLARINFSTFYTTPFISDGVFI